MHVAAIIGADKSDVGLIKQTNKKEEQIEACHIILLYLTSKYTEVLQESLFTLLYNPALCVAATTIYSSCNTTTTGDDF